MVTSAEDTARHSATLVGMSDESPCPPLDRAATIQEEWHRERPDLDVTPLGVIGRVHRLAAALTPELVSVYSKHGLSEGDFDVLAALRRTGPPFERAPSTLAESTMITTGGMTKRLDRLVEAGLVSRRVASDDARRRVVALTAAGRQLIDRAFEEHVANEHRLLSVLPPEDAVQLEGILTRWLGHFEQPS